jgi:hypothetical protein
MVKRKSPAHAANVSGPELIGANMGIDHEPGTAKAQEWCVRVAVSVIQVVPPEVLRPWMICEAYQRKNAYFWPDNRAIGAQLGLERVTSVQRVLLHLEDLGVIARDDKGGHHRHIRLLRRTSDPITACQWSEMEMQAEKRVAARRRPRTSKSFG